MTDELPLEPRFVVWRCDHCRNGIEFDAVQLAGRAVCRVPCPHCGQETSLQEPPPPPPLIPDEGWTQPAVGETMAAPETEKPAAGPPAPVPPAPEISAVAPLPAPPEPAPPKPEIPVLAPLPAPSKPAPSEPEVPAFTPLAELLSELPSIPMPAPSPVPPLASPKPITVSLPPDPPPPVLTRAPVDVRWLTDLGVVYFRQHQFGEAFLCFRHAAQRGFATAQFCLAVCYFNGHGTVRDEAAALPWLRQAAAQGDANAEFTLGLAYRLGRGVAPDPLLAAQWLQQAAMHGHPEAVLRINETNNRAKTPAAPAAPSPAIVSAEEKNSPKPGHDLQRLILGVFKKK